MRTKSSVFAYLVSVVFLPAALLAAGKPEPVKLPAPRMSGGKPLMNALHERKSTRSFSSRKLPPQVLSNLLWAAFGVNRPESGKRTAPSARNSQEIDIYAATEEGLFIYDAKESKLVPVLAGDIRESAGRQPFVKSAPLCLIYVADYGRMGRGPAESKDFYSATDAGFISQNVYLFCASEGLSTVVLGMFDRPSLSRIMNLREDQKIILTQPVGYPK